MDFTSFRTQCQQAMTAASGTFTKPNADWEPSLLIRRDGKVKCMRFDPCFLANPRSKRSLFAEVIPNVVNQLDCKEVALVVSTWVVASEDGDKLPECAPSEHPDRFEALVMIAMDPMCEESWLAKIVRDDKLPPTLTEWTREPVGDSSSLVAEDISIPEVLRDAMWINWQRMAGPRVAHA